ncbi:TolC family protein [Noviherbaspirillum sp. UKPF54]|uniref:TolC family protein n=1 Tax=Noviherbaspirillum sp. UKPF54 TaxID=2601898 RepID=UPI0011B18FFC|nr:TolC family protein [Noviherbaspirillum sp. UKPF54]QDZ27493.1 TolC family protein [Noviherbaspirillum sp. UKPF54]
MSLHVKTSLCGRSFLVRGTALLLLACANPVSAGDALTLELAQRIALGRSRQLAAQDQASSAARDMAAAAGQLPDPVLKLGIDNLPVEGPDSYSVARDSMTMRRIGVMQELTRADKRYWRAERFTREAEKIQADKAATAAAIERDTALAWLDRYYAEAMARLYDAQIEQARLEIEAAQSAYRGGRGAQADLLNARSGMAALEERATEAANRVRNAKTMLTRWVGDAAGTTLAGKPDTGSVRLNVAALEGELAHHPQISTLGRQEAVAEAEARLAQANRHSDWAVEVMFSQRGSSYDNMISVGLSVPLQWDRKNRQDRELSAKLAQLEQAKAEREDALRAHVAEVQTMLNEWESARERRARYERELIPLSRERSEAVLAAYRGGKAGLGDVLAARRNEIDMRMQALQLDADIGRLWAQINFLIPAGGDAPRTMTDKDGK